MRNAFAEQIEACAAEDERVILLSGDIGNRLFDAYKSRFSDRFLNCGVAEANMIGMAAGMAIQGLRPVAYTITSFLTFRPYEQIRLDIGYHQLPVILVGVGGGLSYASNGGSHHSMEEIAALRAIPGLNIISAGDAHEVRAALKAALASETPTYIRIGKKREPLIHPNPIDDFAIGKAITLESGDDIALLACGNILPIAAEAAKALRAKGKSVSLHSVHTVRPLDDALLRELFSNRERICVIEEHNLNGGLGTAILEWAHLQNIDTRKLLRLGAPDAFLHQTLNQNEARALTGLAVEPLVQRIFSTNS